MSKSIFAFSLLFFALVGLIACSSSQKMATSKDKELQRLVSYMVGHFNSAAQAKADTAFLDITLRMVPIEFSEKSKATWLYVEQAVTAAQERPYRQRAYRVESDGNGGYRSMVYTFEDPKPFIGAWKNPAIFKTIQAEKLSLREGCTVFLKKMPDGSFEGSTQGTGCESTLRGAQYATSKVRVTPTGIESWDQGFDVSGKQVWGAEKGGYQFVKIAQ